jgi:O-antigen/teichoic acid export membrane protein
MLIYGAIGMCALAVLGIFPNQIIALAYHGKYEGLGGIMIGWALYSALLGLTFPIQSLVYLLHRQRSLTFWVMVSGVIGACLAAVLCGRFGIWGAISATVVSMAVNALSGLYVTRDVIIGRRNVPLPKELSRGRGANLRI